MVVHRKTGKIEHKIFKNVLDYFDDGDVMVINNTKVFPARMYGTKEKQGLKLKFFYLRTKPRFKIVDVLLTLPEKYV